MTLRQSQRAALRRSLQSCFFTATEKILIHSGNRGKLNTRFRASWKWTLSICSVLQQGLNDDTHISELKEKCTELGIHPSDGSSHDHHKLFTGAGIGSMPNEALSNGLRCLSKKALLSHLDKYEKKGIKDPWQHIFPEDIGSCFEIIRECQPIETADSLKLGFSKERRSKGVHHTPFDVTAHMVDLSLNKIEIPDDEIPNDFVVADLAVGAGAFLLQAARIISNMTRVDIDIILKHHIIGFDIDPEVLNMCSLCFHLENMCKTPQSSYNLYKVDSIFSYNSREQIRSKIKQMMPESKGTPTVTIGNPPYVRVKQNEISRLGFQSKSSGNLSALFIEQALEVTEIGKVVCQIVPQSVVQSDKMQSIRNILTARCSEIDIETFGCVPGYMFDQGKIGSNTSKAITQRVAIITAVTGDVKTPVVKTTRFIRWGSKERNSLFEDIKKQEIPPDLFTDGPFPMIGDKNGLQILINMRQTKRTLSEIEGFNERFNLYVPKAVRYFATASRYDLNRSQMRIIFDDKESRNLAQILINSNYFYWYWRTYGNGFQISNKDVSNLPIPSMSMQKKYQKAIDTLADKLHKKRITLSVKKSNKGMINNIKYDKDKTLMDEIDQLVILLFGLDSPYPFMASKENSLQGYNQHFS